MPPRAVRTIAPQTFHNVLSSGCAAAWIASFPGGVRLAGRRTEVVRALHSRKATAVRSGGCSAHSQQRDRTAATRASPHAGAWGVPVVPGRPPSFTDIPFSTREVTLIRKLHGHMDPVFQGHGRHPRDPCRVSRREHDEGAGRNLPDLTPIHPAPGLSLREVGGCPVEPFDLTTAQHRHNFVERLALG
jgi:hypothetical protein